MDFLQWKALPLLSVIAAFLLLYRQTHLKASKHQCSLSHYDHFWIHSNRVVVPEGVVVGTVEVKSGIIISVVEGEYRRGELPKQHVIDYGEAVVMPGLFDVHAHLDEPGRVEWEGFSSGTKAAAAGGITTLIDMPLNSFPSTVSEEALQLKVEAATEKIYIDVGFWGGLVPENAFNLSALEALLNAGVLGLKFCRSNVFVIQMGCIYGYNSISSDISQRFWSRMCTEAIDNSNYIFIFVKSFMCPSGINDFPMTNATHIKEALYVLAKYRRPLLVHAEVKLDLESTLESKDDVDDVRSYSTYLKTRPPSWEEAAVRELSSLVGDTRVGHRAEGAHLHIVHLSDSGASLDLIKGAKSSGASVSVETCPHYLAFSAEEIVNGDTRFKCAPPIRDADNKEKLWDALMEGHIDMLSSDHSPTVPELKLLDEGDFLRSWGGISSLQFVLPVTWSYGRKYGLTFNQLSSWWSERPAKLAGQKLKGTIVSGKHADIVVWDPDVEFVLDENHTIYHRHPITPYAGKRLSGKVLSTFVRGNLVYNEGEHAPAACGVPILAK